MKKNLFIVFSGAHDTYEKHGVFETEKAAKAFIEKSVNTRGDWFKFYVKKETCFKHDAENFLEDDISDADWAKWGAA